MSLRTKTLLVFIPSVMIFLITVHFTSRRAIRSLILQEATERGAAHARKLSAAVARRMAAGDEKVLLPILIQSKQESDALYAAVYDPDGRVLADTNVGRTGDRDRGANLREHPELTALRARRTVFKDLTILDISYPIETPYEEAKSEEFLFTMERGSLDRLTGTVRVGVPLRSALQTADSISRRILWIVFLGCFLAWGAIWLFLRRMLEGIRSLVEATRRIASGDLQGQVPVGSKDEIGALAASFNKMTEDLNKVTVSRDFIDGVFSSMTDTLIITDRELRVKSANASALALLEYTAEEIIGTPLSTLIDWNQDEVALNALMQGTGALRNRDAVYIAKSGRHIPVSLSFSPLRRKNTTSDDIIFAASDVTELARSNKELEQFAYFASHDLQEPLRKVVSFGDRLKERFADALGEAGRDYLDRMQNAALRMRRLIEDLLQFSRVARSKEPFDAVDLDALIKDVLADFEVRILQLKGEVVTRPLGTVLGHRVALRQLFFNLIGNALKYARPGTPPSVQIRSRRSSDGFVEIDVEDNGIGFDEKFSEQIFEPFQRLHNRTEYEGNGIGLAICRKVIQKHGGEIRVQSSIGVGSTFTVRLPAERAVPKPITPPTAPPITPSEAHP
jgi:PAS domain S-box-containing protein